MYIKNDFLTIKLTIKLISDFPLSIHFVQQDKKYSPPPFKKSSKKN